MIENIHGAMSISDDIIKIIVTSCHLAPLFVKLQKVKEKEDIASLFIDFKTLAQSSHHTLLFAFSMFETVHDERP